MVGNGTFLGISYGGTNVTCGFWNGRTTCCHGKNGWMIGDFLQSNNLRTIVERRLGLGHGHFDSRLAVRKVFNILFIVWARKVH